MKTFRRIFALLIIITLGVPILIVMMCLVGLITGMVSPEFLDKLPTKLADRTPVFFQQVITEINQDDTYQDAGVKAWTKAIGQSATKPAQLVDSIGITTWMKKDVTVALCDMGKMVRGEIPISSVWLDLRPLKAAMQHPAVTQYIKEVFENLPPCSTSATRGKIDTTQVSCHHKCWPACRPSNLEQAALSLHHDLFFREQDMPDTINLMNVNPSTDTVRHHSGDISSLYHGITYSLLLIPFLILLVASFIATLTLHGTLRWLGLSTLIGGICSFALSSLLDWFVKDIPRIFSSHYCHTNYASDDLAVWQINSLDHLRSHLMFLLEPLTNSVDQISGFVAITGIIFFALSYFLTPEAPAPAHAQSNQTQ